MTAREDHAERLARGETRQGLLDSGIPAAHVDQVVDLGFHAAAEAIEKLNSIVFSAAEMAENSDDRLRLLIERVERLEEKKKGISDDIKDVYLEAKAVGYDPQMMRQIVRLRKMNPDDRKEMEQLLDTYKAALGLS